MSHKQCCEKRELLNRENLAQATEIGKLRAENAALTKERDEARRCAMQNEDGERIWRTQLSSERERSAAMREALVYARQQILLNDPKANITWLDDVQYLIHRAIASPDDKPAPKAMVMYCPAGHQHIDEGEWATKPHKTHQCQHVFDGVVCHGQKCGLEWRPANYPTVGIRAPKEAKP